MNSPCPQGCLRPPGHEGFHTTVPDMAKRLDEIGRTLRPISESNGSKLLPLTQQTPDKRSGVTQTDWDWKLELLKMRPPEPGPSETM